MSMQQQATAWVTGNVAYAPETGGEDPKFRVRLRVLNNRRWLDRQTGEWKEGEVNGTDVICWGDLAHNVASSIQKGQPVVVFGRLEDNSWTDQDGVTHRRTRVVADIVAHDLSRGSARFQRLNFNAGASAGDPAGSGGTDPAADPDPDPDGTDPNASGPGDDGLGDDGAADVVGSDPWAAAAGADEDELALPAGV